MKKIIPVFILSLFVATVSAQENDHTMCITLSSGPVVRYNVSEIDKMWFEAVSTSQFPVADDSKAFSIETPAQSVRDLLTAVGPSCTGDFGYIKITDDEYAEIKAFTDELVNGIEKEYDIYRKCHTWVTRNIKYGLNYELFSLRSDDKNKLLENLNNDFDKYCLKVYDFFKLIGVPIPSL